MKYDNHCAGCGKFFPNVSYAIDKQGTLEKMYCSSVCKTLELNKKRIVPTSFSTEAGKQYLADNGRLFNWTSKRSEVDPEEMAKVAWNNYKPKSLDNNNILNIQ